LFVVASLVLVGLPNSASAQAEDWTVPRTSDGQPSLEGVWANNNATPLERPEAWADKEQLTDEELSQVMAAAAEATDPGQDALFGDQLILAAIERTEGKSYDPTTGNYNQFWIADRVFNTNRTSLVIDPPDGRIPDTTPEANAASSARAEYRSEHPADTYTDRPLSERCVSYGAPRIGAGYNSYVQIMQGEDHVVIFQEMIHDARVIPIVARPHLPESIRQLHGDSRGHWEGDTLVIETTNYSSDGGLRGGSSDRTVTERLTRVSDDILNYEVTFDDSATWVKPWTVSIPLRGTDDAVFEYACHEGNIGMEGILAGHRAEERTPFDSESR
jgi:hypothetical protein